MKADWSEFKTKVTNWADRESNDISYRFSVNFYDDYFVLSCTKKDKTHKLKYSKERYLETRKHHSDEEIIPILLQVLKEKFKDIKWSVVGAGRRKKYNG